MINGKGLSAHERHPPAVYARRETTGKTLTGAKERGYGLKINASMFRQYKNEFVLYRTRKKLLTIIAVLLVFLAILTTTIFYYTENRFYKKNLIASNQVMVNQVASVYELCIQNVKEITNKTIFSNKGIFYLSAEERQTSQTKKEIFDMLGSVSVISPYVHSACLYYEEDGMVYSSFSLPYSMMLLENFSDREIFGQERAAVPYLVRPHLLQAPTAASDDRANPLVMSYVVPVHTTSKGSTVYICVNVDIRSLYSTVLRNFELGPDMDFYLVDQDGYIVFHRDPTLLFTKPAEGDAGSGMIISAAESSSLKYTFVLENTISPVESNVPVFFAGVLAAVLVAMLAAIVAVAYSTFPLRKMVQIAKDSHLRDFLAEPGTAEDNELIGQAITNCDGYAVALFRFFSNADTENFIGQSVRLAAEEDGDLTSLTVKMSNDSVAMVFANIKGYGDLQFRKQLKFRCEDLCRSFSEGNAWTNCVLSRVKGSVALLHDAYAECAEAFLYRYSFPRQMILCEDIDRDLPLYEFPIRQERHIINNLLTGNGERCMAHLDEVFADLKSGKYLISDSDVNGYFGIMQENISLQLDTVPIPVRHPARRTFGSCSTLDELYTVFAAYLNDIWEQIADKPNTGKSDLSSLVLDYIEKNFCQNDICLNKISHELSIPQNLISRIVKETAHRTFSEYITCKRIQRSKELLAEGMMSINDVSEAVGFTYPYYYIRKFKEQEGVTPGQYIGPRAIPET